MSDPLDPLLLARIEYAGITASAPSEQRWVDGWLVRCSHAKAKRARCVNALSAGSGELLARIESCQRLYAQAGLPAVFRITPYSQPAGLDGILAGLGMVRFDDTRVMVLSPLDEAALDESAQPAAAGLVLHRVSSESFAERIGAYRGSAPALRRAHAERLRLSAVPMRCFELSLGGEPVACALVAIDGDLAGLYDVHTLAEHRGNGFASHLCREVLRQAIADGAVHAYLQVEADNVAARALYRRIGFVDGYRYHYRWHAPRAGAS